ncbi:MAG: hypothetical protein AAFO76_12125 [Cyanobacteria bacterium J06607_15]
MPVPAVPENEPAVVVPVPGLPGLLLLPYFVGLRRSLLELGIHLRVIRDRLHELIIHLYLHDRPLVILCPGDRLCKLRLLRLQKQDVYSLPPVHYPH